MLFVPFVELGSACFDFRAELVDHGRCFATSYNVGICAWLPRLAELLELHYAALSSVEDDNHRM